MLYHCIPRCTMLRASFASPALEESPGVRLRPQACFEANRRKAARRPRRRIETPQRPLGTFRRWKVPRRRLLQKRLRHRAGIRFAYLRRAALCRSERDNFQYPQFQPHILFSSRRKENVPLTVQEKRAVGGAAEIWFALPRTPC